MAANKGYLRLVRCRGETGGFLVNRQGLLDMADCEFSLSDVVRASWGAGLLMRDSVLRGFDSVRVHDTAWFVGQRCRFVGASMSAIFNWERGLVWLMDCEILDAKQSGLYPEPGGKVAAIRSKLNECGEHAFRAEGDSILAVECESHCDHYALLRGGNSAVFDSKLSFGDFQDSGKARVLNFNRGDQNVAVRSSLTGGVVHVFVNKDIHARFVDCQCTGWTNTGFAVSGDAVLERCHVGGGAFTLVPAGTADSTVRLETIDCDIIPGTVATVPVDGVHQTGVRAGAWIDRKSEPTTRGGVEEGGVVRFEFAAPGLNALSEDGLLWLARLLCGATEGLQMNRTENAAELIVPVAARVAAERGVALLAAEPWLVEVAGWSSVIGADLLLGAAPLSPGEEQARQLAARVAKHMQPELQRLALEALAADAKRRLKLPAPLAELPEPPSPPTTEDLIEAGHASDDADSRESRLAAIDDARQAGDYKHAWAKLAYFMDDDGDDALGIAERLLEELSQKSEPRQVMGAYERLKADGDTLREKLLIRWNQRLCLALPIGYRELVATRLFEGSGEHLEALLIAEAVLTVDLARGRALAGEAVYRYTDSPEEHPSRLSPLLQRLYPHLPATQQRDILSKIAWTPSWLELVGPARVAEMVSDPNRDAADRTQLLQAALEHFREEAPDLEVLVAGCLGVAPTPVAAKVWTKALG